MGAAIRTVGKYFTRLDVQFKPKRYTSRVYEAIPQAKEAGTKNARGVPLLRAMLRSRSTRYRFGPIQASPALCPCEPRRPPALKQVAVSSLA